MGEPTLFTRFRYWVALSVMLPVLYLVMGEEPLFCDLAREGCPLDKQALGPDMPVPQGSGCSAKGEAL